MSSQPAFFDPQTITRPHPKLFNYYLLMSIFVGPAFPIAAIAGYCRYITLRYRFDEHGISMSVGVFFKREVNLTYRRIQDIHVSRDFIQRWMGLADVAIQTASGNAGAEMTIEGVLDADALRDFLYSKMRGARHEGDVPQTEEPAAVPDDEVLALLTEIRDGLRALVSQKASQP